MAQRAGGGPRRHAPADGLDLGDEALVGEEIDSTIPCPDSIRSGGVTPSRSLGTPSAVSSWIAELPCAEL